MMLRSTVAAAGLLSLLVSGCGGGPSAEDAAQAAALEARIAALEQRKERIEDVNAIERLQHAYGYYADRGLWDEAANLFADDGTIEIGLDGVYVGRERVRQYLRTVSGGRPALTDGELGEHLQVMPVITLAPDALTAKARWRAIVLEGELGGQAFWGEGPYENEYVKDDGVWKIKALHWYQALFVPYEGGWQTKPDPTGAKYVSGTLPPDRPPSVEYKTWPDTYLPPFSFANPVAKYVAGGEGAVTTPTLEPHLGAVTNVSFDLEAPSLETLAARAAALERDTARLEDVNAIKKLQRIYGFYTDKQLWSAAADLFSADGEIEVGGRGVYVGRDRIRAFLALNGPEGPQPNRLFDQMQLQPIVHVAPDGQTALGRWHVFAQEAVHGEYANWGLGVLENEYVKEDGVWKIRRHHFFTTMYTPYEAGWAKQAIPNAGPSAELPPDRPPTVAYEAYPKAFVVPFHYDNPVTTAPARAGVEVAAATATAESLGAALTALESRVGLLEDVTQLERMNSIYGYYLAHLQWDDLTGIFSPTGSIEIAMRGVYVGSASVRRNLNLYGQATDDQFGLQHNHMQFQPVIDVAPDGQSAKMRSRALSIMGQWERYSQWMGGVYENEYVKEDGVWKIKRDQVFNTYFVPYTVGWKDSQPRPPPGITATNPPDAPPTHPFEMYPSAFLPPFHYVHPVTGRSVEGAPQ